MNPFILSLDTQILTEDAPAVRAGAEILRRDMRDGLGGHGPLNRIRVRMDSRLEKESYTAHVTEDEILLCCGDDLGAVYALLSISERWLRVRPFDWWMGIAPKRMDTVRVECGTWQPPAYAVRFRCWFVNDEVLFTGWHMEESQRYGVWKRVFETILRCGGNMVIPGTDRAYDGHVLQEMALGMGLWITQHHTELLGARMFARVYPELQPSYTLHPGEYEALWQEAVDRYAGQRVVWAIGFRGQGDKAFWEDDPAYDTPEKRGAFISSVMRRQMELVQARDPEALFATNLYGEMMSLYRNRYLDIPEKVIRLWGDNGYGKMVSRRQNNENPRVDAMPSGKDPGLQGIYYHVSFYDLQAANHITMLQIRPQETADELERTLKGHAGTLWNINVGSVRPHLFMLEIVRRMWKDGHCCTETAAEEFARDYYGSPKAAPAVLEYARHAVPYGPNPDDRIGDQFYHFPLRAVVRALMRGETDRALPGLIWALDEPSYIGQIQRIADIGKEGMRSWQAYLRLCGSIRDSLEEADAQRLRDTMELQGLLHRTGSEGLFAVGQACAHTLHGNLLQAYLWTDRALEAHRRGVEAMRRVGGRFAHYYDNDCFTGVALTCQVLEGLRAWLRIQGDGEMLYDWEKEYLIPAEEKRVELQTHRTVQLSDDELCRRLRGEVSLMEAF